jgi:hypothetical protein
METVTLYRSGGFEGRALDANGLPFAGIELRLSFTPDDVNVPGTAAFHADMKTETDPNGFFACAEGFPALTGTLSIRATLSPKMQVSAEFSTVECLAGQIVNLGDVVLTPQE